MARYSTDLCGGNFYSFTWQFSLLCSLWASLVVLIIFCTELWWWVCIILNSSCPQHAFCITLQSRQSVAGEQMLFSVSFLLLLPILLSEMLSFLQCDSSWTLWSNSPSPSTGNLHWSPQFQQEHFSVLSQQPGLPVALLLKWTSVSFLTTP